MKRLEAMLVTTMLCAGIFFSHASQTFAQLSYWNTKVTLNEIAQGHPGLTSFQGPDGINRLFVTWGGAGNNWLNSLISTDGVNWYNKLTLPQFPPVAYESTGGVSMTASTYCGYVYVAWRDYAYAGGTAGNMWAARSQYGTGWDGAYNVIPSGFYTNSAPSLRGDSSALPIGAAFAVYWIDGYYYPWKEKFNCDFTSPQIIEDMPAAGCFWNTPCNFFSAMFGGWTPLWTGANGTTELLGIGTGAPPQGISEIIYQKDTDYPQAAGTNWTNNGLGGAVNPADSTPYFAWTCHYYNRDTCHFGGGQISIWNVNTGGVRWFDDWSDYMPAVTFFNGQIWVAWAGLDNHYLNVASFTPF